MNVYEAMAKRKTIRDFKQIEIGADVVRKLIEAGITAPSHNHLREWHFIVLRDGSKRKELIERTVELRDKDAAAEIVDAWGLTDEQQREMYLDAIPKQVSMLLEAGCLIVPCFRQRVPLLRPETLSSLNALASMWCCVENILVAAAAEGIFGVTRIPFEDERETMKRFLGVPGGYEIPCTIALGYPKPATERTAQKEIPVDERIHVDGW